MGAVQQVDNILSGIGFAQARKDARHTVSVSVGVQVGHGVDGESDIEPVLVGVARGRFDPDAGGNPGEHDLRDALFLQVRVEIRVRERAPRLLRDDVIFRLLLQLGDKISSIGGKTGKVASLLRPARRAAGSWPKPIGFGRSGRGIFKTATRISARTST